MTLIAHTQSKGSPYHQSTPSPSAAAGLVKHSQAAIEAYSQGLVNHYYFDNGMKKSIKGAKEISRLIDSGFAL